MNIMLVEDDRWFAEVCADILHEHELRICHDAQGAIGVVDDFVPQAILLDIMLPGANGLAFLQELRSYEDTAEVPVIVCSSVRLSAVQERSLKHFKPFFFLPKTELSAASLAAAFTMMETRADATAQH